MSLDDRERASALRARVDDLVERSLCEHWGVEETVEAVLALAVAETGAKAALLHTFDDELDMHLFRHPPGPPPATWDEIVARTSVVPAEPVVVGGEAPAVAQPLDVAGTWFGRAALETTSEQAARDAAPMLNACCEVLDNYLFAVRVAREKHQLMMRVGDALRSRVLSEGVRHAVGELVKVMPIDRVVLAYLAEEGNERALRVQVFEGDTQTFSLDDAPQEERDRFAALARAYLRGESRELLDALDIARAREEVLINGITKEVVVGKVLATSKRGAFPTHDRELLSEFAGFLRQRIVDFNKEWRSLAASFRPEDVSRLLEHDDYEQRFLAPREARVAMLYVDISGFTRVSEQVLKTPARVAALVELWSRDAVDCVWKHGGVFDKMVGDCIIALFGPPFYDERPEDALRRAIRCAAAIRDMTRALPERDDLAELRQGGLAVSTGVNLAPLFVGRFGPNANFTGFSSGMNNTARLQGCAARDEILVMADAVAALGDDDELVFGAERSAPVKNVADPLRFRALEAIRPR